MAEKTTVARPYAQAVFDLARSQGGSGLQAWSDMLQLAASVAADAQMQSLIGDPRIRKEQLVQLVLDVCGKNLDAAGQNFIKLLVENRRLNVLPEIAAHYEAQRAEAEGTLQAQVTSAFPLSEEQQAKIAGALKTRLGRNINVTANVDQSLLGGIIIRAGDMVIDGSARGQLANLATALTK